MLTIYLAGISPISANSWVGDFFAFRQAFLQVRVDKDFGSNLTKLYPELYNWLRNTDIPPLSSYRVMAEALKTIIVS
jgi:hypothetical protein